MALEPPAASHVQHAATGVRVDVEEQSVMAIAILVIGVIIFGIGIAGQVRLTGRRVQAANTGDRKGRNLVLTLAGLIIGAWLVIFGIVNLLRAHAHGGPH